MVVSDLSAHKHLVRSWQTDEPQKTQSPLQSSQELRDRYVQATAKALREDASEEPTQHGLIRMQACFFQLCNVALDAVEPYRACCGAKANDVWGTSPGFE